MNQLHMLSVLGYNRYGYTPCVYQWEGGSSTNGDPPELYTRYVQLASLKKIIQEHPGQDIRVTIFLTEKARKYSWEDRDADEQKPSIPGLKSELLAFREKMQGKCCLRIDDIDDPEKDYVNIPDGQNTEEMNEIFHRMFRSIDEGDIVFFDVTHGFRTLPMLAITVLNYARAVRNIKVGGLYYGAFDARDANGGKAPIFDMTYCDSVMQWSAAAESFIVTGSSNQVHKVYEEQVNRGGENPALKGTVDGLHDLTNCLETSRGKAAHRNMLRPQHNTYNMPVQNDSKKSIEAAYKAFYESYGQLSDTSIENAALKELFGLIEKDTEFFQIKYRTRSDKKNLEKTSIGLAAVQWAIYKGLTQQGLTALQETLRVYVGERCGFDEELNGSDPEGKKKILIALQICNWDKLTSKERQGKMKNRPTYSSGKGTGQDERVNKDMPEIIAKTFSRDNVRALYTCSENARNARNSINHFGLADKDNSPYTYEKLNTTLKDTYESFLKCVKQDCESYRKTTSGPKNLG